MKMSEFLIIAVAGLKGGIGKTTSSIHIAGALALAGQRVLLADGDRIRTSTSWARGDKLPFTVAPVAAMGRARDYDIIVLDTEGGPDNTDLLEFARTADLTVLPTTTDINGLDGAVQTAEILKAGGVPKAKYAALLTFVRPRGMKEITARKGLEGAGVPVLNASVDGKDIIYHGFYDIGIAVARAIRAAIDRWVPSPQTTKAPPCRKMMARLGCDAPRARRRTRSRSRPTRARASSRARSTKTLKAAGGLRRLGHRSGGDDRSRRGRRRGPRWRAAREAGSVRRS